MKTKVIKQQQETPKIDWTKQNLLTDNRGAYIFSTGREGRLGYFFEAIVLHDAENVYSVGMFSNEWAKDSWELVTEEVTFVFNAK